MKILLPIHLDGGNRGCEAITLSTTKLLNIPKEQIIALSNNTQLDTRLGLNKYVTLQASPKATLQFKIKRKLLKILTQDELKATSYTYRHTYLPFLKQASENDIMLSTGGDMMCYGNNKVIYTNEMMFSKGVKTILWGCSIGKENLTPEKIKTLQHFSKIYTRESLTTEVLTNLGLKNVATFPDPAFILNPEVCQLPNVFTKDVIGINLSNYVVGDYNLDTNFGNEIKKLIEYILQETKLNILLIPHVLWKGQDDRIITNYIVDHYKNNSRINALNSDSYNYCQLRYIISQCKYFIGARTHAVISAYSTCTPAIALGYSIKSKGIAKDLNLPKELIVDSKNYTKDELLTSFKYLLNSGEEIRKHLQNTIPEYIKQLNNVASWLFK